MARAIPRPPRILRPPTDELRRQLATLAYSQVRPATTADAVAAAGWWNLLARLGLRLPLVVRPRLRPPAVGRAVRARARGPARRRHAGGLGAPRGRALPGACWPRLAESQAIEELGTAPLRDETLAVILARVIGDLYLRWPGRPRLDAGALPLSAPAYDVDCGDAGAEPRPGLGAGLPPAAGRAGAGAAGAPRSDRGRGAAPSGAVPRRGGRGRSGRPVPDRRHPGRRRHRRLLAAAAALAAGDQAPRRRRSGSRSTATPRSSAAATSTRSCPGELAHDDDVFALKALSDDLLYYGHERQHDAPRRLHYLLVDGSASMRGAREIFARGLALALAKKLSLAGGQGTEIWLRFFDSRLHPRLDLGRAARRDLPRLLGFRSERGRNYARVFWDLAVEVARLTREEGRAGGADLHHPRRLPHPGSDGAGAGRRGAALRHLRAAVPAARISTICRFCTATRW